jgi:hypothetical protein
MFKSTFTPFLLATALLLMLLTACCKEKNQPPDEPIPDNPWGLPNATETGESTFGCLLDGKPWVAGIDPSIIAPGLWPLDMSYDETGTGRYYNNGWGMSASSQPKDSMREFINISAYKFDKSGLLNWRDNKIGGTVFLRATIPGRAIAYNLDTLLPYRVEITKLDTVNNICAGRFEFFATRNKNNLRDTIHVTEGRFDEIYAPE